MMASPMMGYRFAVAWIATNDEPTFRHIDDMAEMLTTMLLADMTGKDPKIVARDIIAYRKKENISHGNSLPHLREMGLQ